MYCLKNPLLNVRITSKGAEVQSLLNCSNGTEYLWQADPNFWGRHAPILFPIVGQIENNSYGIDGVEYRLTQHGFARDMEFNVIAENESSLLFELTSNLETKKVYPYDFILHIGYRLISNKLEISYNVENTGTILLPFSIGAHPGFRVPLNVEEKFEDYYLEFEKEETLNRILFEGGLLSGKYEKDYLKSTKIIPLSHALFENDALIFRGHESNYISIKSKKSNRVLKVGIADFPYLGIWSPPGKKAPFVCIEPWYGIADTRGAAKAFKEKEGRIILNKGEQFACHYSFEII